MEDRFSDRVKEKFYIFDKIFVKTNLKNMKNSTIKFIRIPQLYDKPFFNKNSTFNVNFRHPLLIFKLNRERTTKKESNIIFIHRGSQGWFDTVGKFDTLPF